MKNIIYILLALSLVGCRTLKSSTTTTKEMVKITYRDTTVKVPSDSTVIVKDIVKNVTPEEKKVIENIPEQTDTIVQGNIQVIRHFKKGKETLQIKTKPKDLTIKNSNKETEKVKVVVTEKVYEPSNWDKFKTMLSNWFWLIVILGILAIVFLILKKSNKLPFF